MKKVFVLVIAVLHLALLASCSKAPVPFSGMVIINAVDGDCAAGSCWNLEGNITLDGQKIPVFATGPTIDLEYYYVCTSEINVNLCSSSIPVANYNGITVRITKDGQDVATDTFEASPAWGITETPHVICVAAHYKK